MKKLLTFFTILFAPVALCALNMDEWTSTDYVYDHNGNVTEILDGEHGDVIGEYSYDPYGNLTKIKGEAAYENKVRFSTKEIDGSGLYYYGYRYYNPKDGRWQNRDPLSDEFFLLKHTETSSYAYTKQMRAESYKNLLAFSNNNA